MTYQQFEEMKAKMQKEWSELAQTGMVHKDIWIAIANRYSRAYTAQGLHTQAKEARDILNNVAYHINAN